MGRNVHGKFDCGPWTPRIVFDGDRETHILEAACVLGFAPRRHEACIDQA